jgi:hypothetical protein
MRRIGFTMEGVVRARFGLTQDLSDVGGSLVLEVRHTVALGATAKLPAKPFDSEGFVEQIVAMLMRLLHNHRRNPPIEKVLTVILQWNFRHVPSRPRKAASSLP